MEEKMSVEDLDLKGKTALIRVDFNVPLAQGRITDDTRIRASLPTIEYVLDQGAAVILMSHLGRPKPGHNDPQFSLTPCAHRLSELINRKVIMAPDCRGSEVERLAANLQPGDVMLLENLRFHVGEEKPEAEPSFTSALASLGDVYINDAFGSAHRAHASVASVAHLFPGKAAAGYLMMKEISFLGKALNDPERPFCAILGGSKISTKFKAIESLMKKSDQLLIGGAMAFTFMKAEGKSIGNSLFEPDFIAVARQLLDVSSSSRCAIHLPVDIIAVKEISPNSPLQVIDVQQGIPEGFQGVDIGPQTIKRYSQLLKSAKTIFWNGPLGVFECPPFDKGTREIAVALSQSGATTIIGGGDSVAAIEQAGVADKITHLSTGGGASLEYIETGHLPGIDALSNKI